MRVPELSRQREEPIGIVIADGGRAEATPRFSAFVWGPVPDEEDFELVSVLASTRALLAAV